MNVWIENMRKMMGWCPNASTIKYKGSMHFDTPQMKSPDIGGGSTQAINGWLNKYRNRLLLSSLIFTLFAIGFFRTGGYDLNKFIIGMIIGLSFSFVAGFGEWRRLNKAASERFRSPKRTLKRKAVQFLVVVSLIALVVFTIGFFAVKSNASMQEIHAFLSGFILSVWAQYFEVLYWERKNGKTLIVEKTSFYAVDV